MSGPSVSFEHVHLTLGRSRILNDVSFTVEAGSVHVLAGPNGAGKSSLVKTLLGLMPHTGEVTLQWPSEPGVTGYVPQSLDFDRSLPMTVADFMATMTQRRPSFLGLSRRHAVQAAEALARVGMQDKRSRRMGALSGGERQRVLLAQALIPAPSLLVLDEPMAALDEAGVQVFEALLADWRASGTTIFWVEHDLDAARRLADRVTGLNRRVLFEGPPGQVLTAQGLLTLFSSSAKPVADREAA
jgi:zinc transport system ATP-binding protein